MKRPRKPKPRARKPAAISAVTYEVVRSRLLAITEEMRIALQSVSGSPTVTEASDFSSCRILAAIRVSCGHEALSLKQTERLVGNR